MEINLYPEMNKEIVNILRLGGDDEENRFQMYAAALIEAYRASGLEPDEIPQLQTQLKAALKDLYYIHCAGQKGCKICANKGQCKEFEKRIGHCTSFEWRGPQPPKEKL